VSPPVVLPAVTPLVLLPAGASPAQTSAPRAVDARESRPSSLASFGVTASMPGPWASFGISSTQPGLIRLAIVSLVPSGWTRPLFSSKISR